MGGQHFGYTKFMFVEDTSFPPDYTRYDKQEGLVEWAKFAVQHNPYLRLNAIDGQTEEVALVRQSMLQE